MPKKICEKCQKENGVRSRRCKFCDAGFAFKIKKEKIKTTKIDWKLLQPGDVVKVLGGGPIWRPVDYVDNPNVVAKEEGDNDDDEDDDDEDGSSSSKSKTRDKISMGYRGKFRVFRLDKNGIIAYGIEKNSGYCHIWMAEEKLIDNRFLKRPHRLVKVAW